MVYIMPFCEVHGIIHGDGCTCPHDDHKKVETPDNDLSNVDDPELERERAEYAANKDDVKIGG
jgi:hypothetical protein